MEKEQYIQLQREKMNKTEADKQMKQEASQQQEAERWRQEAARWKLEAERWQIQAERQQLVAMRLLGTDREVGDKGDETLPNECPRDDKRLLNVLEIEDGKSRRRHHSVNKHLDSISVFAH